MFRLALTKKLHHIAGALLLVSFIAGPLMAQQQVPIEPNRMRIISYSGLMIPFLGHLATTYRVVIGVEVDPANPNPSIQLEVRTPSIDDVLNAVVNSRPQYHWRRDGALLDVLPIKRACPLLETPVEEFQVTEVTEAEAIDQLLSRPEVVAQMQAANMQRDSSKVSLPKNLKKFSLALSKVTVREALHRITSASGSQFWVFQRTGSNAAVFTVTTSDRVE